MFRIWNKDHKYYTFFKYNFYKPIRNWLCHYGYGYHLCDEKMVERRREFIERCKNAKRMDT